MIDKVVPRLAFRELACSCTWCCHASGNFCDIVVAAPKDEVNIA